MSVYHILNGDVLAEKFPTTLEGSRIIIREAFMEGPVSTTFDADYWRQRSDHIADTFNTSTGAYQKAFYSQLDLLNSIDQEDKVYLWFEDDLFCQVNMWFALYYITRRVTPVFYRVFPEDDAKSWTGFGRADEQELKRMFSSAVIIEPHEVDLIREIWEAYVREDTTRLLVLADHAPTSMRHATEVIQAHIDRLHPDATQRQPQECLREIIAEGYTTFEEIFAEFTRRAGIYGYGDLQIEQELKKMNAYPG